LIFDGFAQPVRPADYLRDEQARLYFSSLTAGNSCAMIEIESPP
jgi:hypothetical protein